jgi:hypothetical protein
MRALPTDRLNTIVHCVSMPFASTVTLNGTNANGGVYRGIYLVPSSPSTAHGSYLVVGGLMPNSFSRTGRCPSRHFSNTQPRLLSAALLTARARCLSGALHRADRLSVRRCSEASCIDLDHVQAVQCNAMQNSATLILQCNTVCDKSLTSHRGFGYCHIRSIPDETRITEVNLGVGPYLTYPPS